MSPPRSDPPPAVPVPVPVPDSPRARLRVPALGPIVALIAVYCLFAALAPDTFPSARVAVLMLRQTAVVVVAAVGMTMVVASGGIDLSVGSLVAIGTVVIAKALQAGNGPIVAALLAIAVTSGVGALSGAAIAKLRITPFIVTLGAMSIVRGAAKGLAHEQKIDVDPRGLEALLGDLPRARAWMLFPPGVWIAIVTAILIAVTLRSTRFGRHVVAIGSSEPTARLCGVPVDRTKILLYALAGALAGLASVLELSTLTVGDPTDSIGLELVVIAAVVIGGGSLSGGEASVLGTVVGAMLMTVIRTGNTHVGLRSWVQEIVTGAIILLAVGIERVRRRGRG